MKRWLERGCVRHVEEPDTTSADPEGGRPGQPWLAFLVGVALAFFLARFRFWGREFLDAIFTLPLVMPPTVLGYYLIVIVGRNGLIGRWIYETFGITIMLTGRGR